MKGVSKQFCTCALVLLGIYIAGGARAEISPETLTLKCNDGTTEFSSTSDGLETVQRDLWNCSLVTNAGETYVSAKMPKFEYSHGYIKIPSPTNPFSRVEDRIDRYAYSDVCKVGSEIKGSVHLRVEKHYYFKTMYTTTYCTGPCRPADYKRRYCNGQSMITEIAPLE